MGYGFIKSNGGGDIFVHISAVERAGLDTLAEGQAVEYDVMAAGGRQFAEHLKPIAMLADYVRRLLVDVVATRLTQNGQPTAGA